MKRQLDRLKGKRLVTGDPNLMTKDEICINATPNGVEVKEIGTDGKIKDLAGSGDNGGGGANINDEALDEPLYYKLEWSEDITTEVGSAMLAALSAGLPTNSYVVLNGGHRDMPQIEVPANVGLVWGSKSQVKIKIINKYVTSKDENEYGVDWYKINILDFMPMLLEIFSSSGLNMIEISKEEYYSDIEVKYEDIPIQQIQ